MKSLMSLWQVVLQDRSTWCNVSTIRDGKTAADRVEREGDSFLTITLPAYGKDLERALAEEQVASHHFVGFRRRGGLPLFLGGFLELVFDRSTGRLLDEPDVDAIQALRQLAGLCGKVERPCSPIRERAAYRRYVECEQEVKENDKAFDRAKRDQLSRLSLLLMDRVFSRVDRKVYLADLIPQHGPGAVAESGLSGNAKADFVFPSSSRRNRVQWPKRAEQVFPSGDYLLPNYRYWKHLEAIDFLEPGDELPVRVVQVPKTLKTPRIIAIEPVVMQFLQQALWRSLREEIERDDILSCFLDFSDSETNRNLAREGSVTGDLATLDLSEASDRVSNEHVREMTKHHSWLFQALDATRSRKAHVPGQPVQRLAKFASMGSAVCFPMESLAFLALVFGGIEDQLGRPLTRSDVKSFRGRVRVFGDDIVVPSHFATSVITKLEAFGHRVNTAKSFWTGKFRESCGGDYYDGTDVGYVRCRRDLPGSHVQTQEMESLVSLRDQLYRRGYWQATKALDADLERLLNGHFPVVGEDSPAWGRFSFLGVPDEGSYKWDENTQVPLVKAYRGVAPPRRTALDGVPALMKCLSGAAGRPSFEGHLEFAGRPESVYTKLGWVAVQ